MTKEEIKKEFLELCNQRVIKRNGDKTFLSSIDLPKDTFVNWIKTVGSSNVGLIIAVLVIIGGISVSTFADFGDNFFADFCERGSDFFGIFQDFHLGLFIPFLLLAIIIFIITNSFSRKYNKKKESISSCKDFFCNINVSIIFIPIFYFLNKGNFESSREKCLKKIKSEMDFMACDKNYIDSFFTFINKLSDEEIKQLFGEILPEVLKENRESKLYEKDFNFEYLYKKSKNFCKEFDNKYIDDTSIRNENEKILSEIFDKQIKSLKVL